MENLQVQLIRPPVLVRRGPNRRVSMRSAQHWAFAFGRHILSNRLRDFFQPVLYTGVTELALERPRGLEGHYRLLFSPRRLRGGPFVP